MFELIRKNGATIVLAGLALAAAAFIWLVLPHEREVKSLLVLLFKLLPFVLATFAIAHLDLETARKYYLPNLLVPLTFLVFFCVFVPKIFFYSDDFGEMYYLMLTATPFIILSLVLAFRLGGGSTSWTVRLAFSMILLMLSGLEDLAFLTVNHHTDPRWATIPEVWDWASHMTVFLGHPPTKYEAFAFIAVHVLLALLVLFLPARLIARSILGRIFRNIANGGKNVLTRSFLRNS